MVKETLDYELLKERKKVKFCKKCVLSNQRPRTEFDNNGVCSACNYKERKKTIDWEQRNNELKELCEKFRSRNGKYDVIVPGSGGKDSAYVAHILKSEFNMHPLCVTWAPHEYTNIGKRNFDDFTKSGFDNLTCFQDGRIHSKLSLLGFEYVADNFLPFNHGQKAYAFNLSVKLNIPLMFYGECGPVEYGGDTKNKIDKPKESFENWDFDYHKGVNIDKILKKGFEVGILNKNDLEKSYDFYRHPTKEDIDRVGCEMHWMSYYKEWLPQENYYYAAQNTDFTPRLGRSQTTYTRFASLDDSTDGVHWLLGYVKFGLGRATSDAAHEVREGQFTRDEGIHLVKKYDHEIPEEDIKNFINYVGITRERFDEVIEFYYTQSPNVWKKVNGKWKLRHTLTNDGCDDSPYPKNR